STNINFVSFMGATTVGSLTQFDGKPAPYSNLSGFVRDYRVGDIISRKVQGGIDINNDGVADFIDSQLSDGAQVADYFDGQPAQVSTLDEARENLRKPTFLMGRDFLRATYPSATFETELLDRRDQVYGSLVQYPSQFHFRLAESGVALFDPAGDGSPNQVALNKGTSYALGNICQ
ncbi:MAG: hypothetical protein AAF203_05765, partial [Pseudomonadota bacterium]